MDTQRVYQASAADWQNRMRIASYVGTLGADNDAPSVADVVVKVVFCLVVLALVLGALA